MIDWTFVRNFGGWPHLSAIWYIEIISCWWVAWDLDANRLIMLSLTSIFIFIPHEYNLYPCSGYIHADLPFSQLFWPLPRCICPPWWGGWGCTLDPLAHPHLCHDLCNSVPLRRGRPWHLQCHSWGCDCPGYSPLLVPTQVTSIGYPATASAEFTFPCRV